MKRLQEKNSWEGEKIKGSRFIVNLGPVFSEEEAKQFLDMVAHKYPDARHHCYAYCLSNGISRSSDSGEPRGSAGIPILQRLEGVELVDSIVVVTRYFGGTKLGIGGLIRAYGGAAGDALKETEKVELVLGDLLELQFSYAQSSIVSSIVNKFSGEIKEEQYSDIILMKVFIEQEKSKNFAAELKEKSSNKVLIQKSE
jgi:uncharacterized YigZ family protein